MGPGSALRAVRDDRGELLLLHRRVFLQQRILEACEDEGERQYAEDFEAHPEICRLRAPDDLVEHCERKEEYCPAQGELAPAFLGQVEYRIEHDRQQRLVEE